jgi:hypothetical protein
MTAPTTTDDGLPMVVTTLMRGVIYREANERVWRLLVPLQARVRDYVSVLGLSVVVDEAEGYAYLQSRPEPDDADPDRIPRLIPRRPLSYPVSLLLALLRKRLAEFDAKGTDTRLMLTRDQIVDMMRLFLPSGDNEVRTVDRIEGYLTKAVELGFVRRVRDGGSLYEVRRILKAFVDGQWLADFDRRLAEYVEHAGVAPGQADREAEA